MKGIKDMAKLVFNYGAMGSSKTANELMYFASLTEKQKGQVTL